MEPFFSHALSKLTRQAPRNMPPNHWVCSRCRAQPWIGYTARRTFKVSRTLNMREKKKEFETFADSEKSYTQPYAEMSQDVPQVEKNHFDRVEEESKQKQMQSPWMREGSDKAPVQRMRSAGAMTKGKLLTTPSRMLKLILPLTTRDANNDRKDVEPLALLVHPQQPLSYLERLIQSELPPIMDGNKERIPQITFRAQDAMEEDIMSGTPAVEELEGERKRRAKADENTSEETTDPEQSGAKTAAKEESSPSRETNQSSASAENVDHKDFVRWSPSTEMGDFIRDAARAKEFAVDIEGAPESIYVGVPSFADRTFYLRMRLRKTSRRILEYADIKKECDQLAQQGAQRVAKGGFLGLVGWWGAVFYLTFKTEYGWDVMEPVTYLVGLTGLIGGYTWFLYHNREVSYRSAMNFTISRRQSQLYEQKGFNLEQWERLVEEANKLRREIKMVAEEYDVEWDEIKDEHDEKVAQALREERKKERKGKKEEKEDEDDDDDDKGKG